MFPYVYILVLAFSSFILTDIFKYKSLNNILVFGIFVSFVLIAGFRYRVGGDSLAYYDLYDNFPSIDKLSSLALFERGYGPFWYLLCAIAKLISPDFFVLQFLEAVVINSSVIHIFYKYSKNICSCLLIYTIFYFIYFNMEIMREALAVSIFLWNIDNLIKKRYLKYYFGCFIAIGFHLSAVITLLIPLLLLFFYKIKSFEFIIFFVFCLFILLLYLIKNRFDIFGFLPPFLKIKIHSAGTKGFFNLKGTINNMLPFFSFYLPFFIFNRVNKENKQKTVMFSCFLLFLFLGGINYSFSRFSNYFIVFAITYFVNNTVALSKASVKHNFSIVSFLLCLILFSFNILTLHLIFYYSRDTSDRSMNTRMYQLWVPYESIFSETRHVDREKIFYNALN